MYSTLSPCMTNACARSLTITVKACSSASNPRASTEIVVERVEGKVEIMLRRFARVDRAALAFRDGRLHAISIRFPCPTSPRSKSGVRHGILAGMRRRLCRFRLKRHLPRLRSDAYHADQRSGGRSSSCR